MSGQLHPVLTHHIVNSLGWSSLRPLQQAAIQPILDGDDALLLAPTAGGKTEAAVFPLLTAMAQQHWSGLSVLYVCPLRALLNNLEPRVASYASWLGRRVGLWHGDVSASTRRRLLQNPPDLLLTTPESLESMLVSTKVDPHAHFANVRAVVVDEVHAFAGDDRGWHLLAVVERISRVAGRPVQRIGLSATVGNPPDLMRWLQGSGADGRRGHVIAPETTTAGASADVTVDYVGSLDNAAVVIASLHRGEKRLVFCESRRQAEELTQALRAHQVTTFVSHSSLALDERRQAEAAFAEARDCVIVATSTLELGVDVGDLDRVIQIDAPSTVASFLQRLGRTGRRPGSQRSTLFLETTSDALVQAMGLLRLWASGWVEPIQPPPQPRHLVAQQLLALCLQEHRVGQATWTSWFDGLPGFLGRDAGVIADWLLECGHLERDSGMLFIGREAERRYGRRNFMDLLSVFSADPQFSVIAGRQDVGRVDPLVLTRKVVGPRTLSLAGQAWKVTHIDWERRRCWVEPTEQAARMQWQSQSQPLSYELCQARREVLLGDDPPVRLSRRAVEAIAAARIEAEDTVSANGTVIDRADAWWWTWAGARANATLAAALPDVVDARIRYDNDRLRLRGEVGARELSDAIATIELDHLPLPDVDPRAVRGLKFADALPSDLATATLAVRMADSHAPAALRAPRRDVVPPG